METTPERPLALWTPAGVSPREAAAGKKRMRVDMHRFRPPVCVPWADHTLGRRGLCIQLPPSPGTAPSAAPQGLGTTMFLMLLTP